MTDPAPGPAPAVARVAAQARWDALVLLRNGEQLLLTIVLPVLVLVGLTATDVVRGGIDVVAPGVLALAVLSTSFTGQAIATGFDRRAGVLRLLGTTPLGRAGLLAGRVLAVLAVQALQVLVLGAVAVATGWRPDPAGIPAALLAIVLGTAAFTGLALLLAGTLRAEAVLAVANLVWVLLLVGGGVVVPAERLPGPLPALAGLLPSGALGDALRLALSEGRLDVAAMVLLGLWATAAAAACVRWFRWD